MTYFRRHFFTLFLAAGVFFVASVFLMYAPARVHAGAGVPDHVSFSSVPCGDPCAAGATFTVVMEVRDQFGDVVTGAGGSGFSVTLILNDNDGYGGVLGGTLTRTSNTSGVITFNNLTVSQPGRSYVLDASSVSGGLFLDASSDPLTFHGPVSYMALNGGITSSMPAGTLSPCPQIFLYDDLDIQAASDNSSQVTAAIGTNPGAGVLGGTLTETVSGGVANFCNLQLNTPGAGYTLTFSKAGLSTVTSDAFTMFGPAAKLGFYVQPTTVASSTFNGSLGVKVVIQDSGGNTVANDSTSHPVTLALGSNPGGGTLGVGGGSLTRNDFQDATTDGVVDFTDVWVNAQGIGYTIVASASGLTSGTSNAFTIYGAPTQVTFTGQPADSSPVTGGFVSCVQAAIKDSLGTTVANSTRPITLAIGTNPSGATLGGGTTRNASSGSACFFDITLTTAGVGYTLTASSPALTTGTSNAFTITAGTATKLGITTQPSTTAAGSAFTMVVAVQDTYSNTKLTDNSTSITIAIGTNAGSGTLGGTVTKTVTAGVATFNDLTLSAAGTGYTVTAAATGLTGATSDAFNITAASSGGGGNSSGGGSSSSSGSGGTGQVAITTLPGVLPPGLPPAVIQTKLISLLQALVALLMQVKSAPLPPNTVPPQTPVAPPVFERNLGFGDTGADVLALQKFLVAKNTGPRARELKVHGVTSRFGHLTELALAEFQQSVGVTATGYMGDRTRAFINGLR